MCAVLKFIKQIVQVFPLNCVDICLLYLSEKDVLKLPLMTFNYAVFICPIFGKNVHTQLYNFQPMFVCFCICMSVCEYMCICVYVWT